MAEKIKLDGKEISYDDLDADPDKDLEQTAKNKKILDKMLRRLDGKN